MLKYFKFYLYINFLNLFKTINKLLIKLEKVYENLYYKKYITKKFKKLKINLKYFHIFNFQFFKIDKLDNKNDYI